MSSFHLTFSADGRQALFPSEPLRRRAVHTLARVAGAELLLFCVVDDHVHVVVLASRERAGRLAQRLVLALRSVAVAPLAPAHLRPVDGRSHLRWLVRYLLDQPRKHGLGSHPASWSGSCLPDLVGARVLPGLRLRIGDALPRLRLREVQAVVGLAPEPLVGVGDDVIALVGLPRLVAAASAAVAAPPELQGRGQPVLLARRAVVHLARAGGYATRPVSLALGITPQSTRRLARASVEPRILEAVRRQLALEARARPALPAFGLVEGPQPR